MNAMAVSNIDVQTARVNLVFGLERERAYWTMGLMSSASLGAIAGLSGILIGAASFVGLASGMRWTSSLVTWLIVISFPLFVLAAHCLDRLDDVEKRIRAEYCKQHGLKETEC